MLLGDVPDNGASGTVSSPVLQDETIEAMLDTHPYNEAVRQLAMGLLSRFSGEPDKYEEGNGLRLEWKSRLEGWKAVLKELKVTAPPATVRSGIAIGQLSAPDMAEMRSD